MVLNCCWMRRMAFSLSASKRSTRTGVVLDARIRPKPSENSTRRPSMVMTSSAPSNWAVAASLAMSSWPFSPSGRSMFSSGVEMLCGRLLRIAEGLLLRERISSIRQPAYMPSSKPNQRSLKKVCPLISPASSAPSRFMAALMKLWPVLPISGCPPCRRIHGASRRVDLTSKITFPFGLRLSTSWANSISWRSG